MRNLPPADTGLPGLLRKAFAIALAVTVLTLIFMFSLVLIAVILLGGAMAWGYLLWKTRHLRKQMRELHARTAAARQHATRSTGDAEVIEGEVVQVHTSRESR